VPPLARGQPAGARVGAARLQRRGGQAGRRGEPGRRPGRLLRRGQVRADGARAGRARQIQRHDQVRGGGTCRAAAGADRLGPDFAGGVPGRRPPGRTDGDPYRVRRPRRQPVHDPVPAHRWRARKLLLLHRLRGAHRRRAGRRGDDGRAPGVRRGPVPRQLSQKRRGADPGPRRHVRSRVRRSGGVAGQAPLRPPVTGARYAAAATTAPRAPAARAAEVVRGRDPGRGAAAGPARPTA
jgi:hypothetical protein